MTDKIKTNEFDVKIKYESVIKFNETDELVWFKAADDSIEISTDENKILTKEDYQKLYIYILRRFFIWGKNKFNVDNKAMAKGSIDIIKLIFKEEKNNG